MGENSIIIEETQLKILVVADEESPYFWDYYTPDKLENIDLIISCGDLKAEYLSFLVTMARCPLLYIHGNHDARYERKPPEGCVCIEDDIYEYKGIRILGLGGSYDYSCGPHQYTWKEMDRRVRRLWYKLWRKKGFDILVTHAPAYELGDSQDIAHVGFPTFVRLLERYRPKYMLHGHVHMNYGCQMQRIRRYEDTTIINGYNYHIFQY